MSNQGVNKLTGVMQERIHRIGGKGGGKSGVLDFGKIQTDRSLLTNKFPVPIPFGSYMSCIEIPQTIAEPMRVLIGWVGDDATVISTIWIANE
jgi:hypothetical protein